MTEHIESEIAIKPERISDSRTPYAGAYRIGDCDQAGTRPHSRARPPRSISNRRLRSSRNSIGQYPVRLFEHIESEIAIKPELDRRLSGRGG